MHGIQLIKAIARSFVSRFRKVVYIQRVILPVLETRCTCPSASLIEFDFSSCLSFDILDLYGAFSNHRRKSSMESDAFASSYVRKQSKGFKYSA
jgi:hypothetical protein